MELVKAIFGSRLYGTEIPTSDTDYKFLFLPEGRDILLQRAAKSIQNNTGNDNSKNGAEDVDCEGFSLKQFLHLLSQGQTLAVEFMFLPKTAIVGEIHDSVKEIFANRDNLISKKISPFVGYCRAQSSKYCLKSERTEAARICSEFFKDKPTTVRIEEYLEPFTLLTKDNSYIEFLEDQSGDQVFLGSGKPVVKKVMPMISCCGRKLPTTANCKRAYDLYEELYQSYGDRAKQALENKNLDYKALYHALRIANEAKELLKDGTITFPRPEANLLLQIRRGELPYTQISELLEEAAADVESLLLTSTLRESADHKWIDNFVEYWYYKAVLDYKNKKTFKTGVPNE